MCGFAKSISVCEGYFLESFPFAVSRTFDSRVSTILVTSFQSCCGINYARLGDSLALRVGEVLAGNRVSGLCRKASSFENSARTWWESARHLRFKSEFKPVPLHVLQSPLFLFSFIRLPQRPTVSKFIITGLGQLVSRLFPCNTAVAVRFSRNWSFLRSPDYGARYVSVRDFHVYWHLAISSRFDWSRSLGAFSESRED